MTRRVTRQLGIAYPIIQGGRPGRSYPGAPMIKLVFCLRRLPREAVRDLLQAQGRL
ncbi:hypothetical protein AB4Z46_07770 [Variovorax sp. M-6]|uniref:hypothetical protein n=1 Tax=Variovorax sp. M-6 TaxID=3233041 RepID=UPI003F9873EE